MYKLLLALFALLVMYFTKAVFSCPVNCEKPPGVHWSVFQNDRKPTREEIMELTMSVRERPSIMETFYQVVGNKSEVILERKSDQLQQKRILCSGDSYRLKVDDAIRRTLNFYETQLDELDRVDYAMAILFLKTIDSRRGGTFQLNYPIDSWLSEMREKVEAASCDLFMKNVESWASLAPNWKSNVIVYNDTKYADHVGTEKETFWATLSRECLKTMLVECEVPNICNRVMFDEIPGSQYFLTHQLLFRIIAQSSDCLSIKSQLVDLEVNMNLCAKMSKEAELIADIDAIVGVTHLRDLFAEQTAFCGTVGFPNLFRADYLEMLLSWQSKSDNGCFLEVNSSTFLTAQPGLRKKATKKELGQNEMSEDFCEPHLTAMSLMALAMYKDYMEEICVVE